MSELSYVGQQGGGEEVDGGPGGTAAVRIRTIDGADSETFELLQFMGLSWPY